MIGKQTTGAIEGVRITVVAHEGLSVSINGQPGRLAIIDESGQVIAAGEQVARECEAVAVNGYRNLLSAKGHLRVLSAPISVQDNQPAANDSRRRAA